MGPHTARLIRRYVRFQGGRYREVKRLWNRSTAKQRAWLRRTMTAVVAPGGRLHPRLRA